MLRTRDKARVADIRRKIMAEKYAELRVVRDAKNRLAAEVIKGPVLGPNITRLFERLDREKKERLE